MRTHNKPETHHHCGVSYNVQMYHEEPNRHTKQRRARFSWYIVGSSKVHSGYFTKIEAIKAAVAHINQDDTRNMKRGTWQEVRIP